MDTREKLLARLRELESMPPLEAAKQFLGTYFYDAVSMEESYSDIREIALMSTRSANRGIKGIESLLNQELDEGVLFYLVEWEANLVLQDPYERSDAGARAWLEDVVRQTKQILADVESSKE